MSDQTVLREICQLERLRESCQILGRCPHKIPLRKSRRIVVEIRQSVLAQHRRTVVGRIKTDADQMRSLVDLRGFEKFPVNRCEFVAQEGTKVREWASRVNKRNQYGFTLEVAQMNCFSVLIDKSYIGDWLPQQRL